MTVLPSVPLPPSTDARTESLHTALLSIIVVSHNTRALTMECIATAYRHLDALNVEVIVVDNGSYDGSGEAIHSAFPQVRLIRNERNTGFGAANNQAMRLARGSLFLLLNSDAFLHPGAISALVACMGRHPRSAVVGARLLNSDGSLQRSCFRFPSPQRAWLENLGISAVLPSHPRIGDYSRWAHDTERKVDFVGGACMLVRREAYTQVGGFDERFFMYAEETDWQRRLTTDGWDIVFAPNAHVTHLGGASGGSEKVTVKAHFFESLDEYQRKHHGSAGLISLRCAMAVGCSIRALAWAAASLRPSIRKAALQKARLHWQLLMRQALHW